MEKDEDIRTQESRLQRLAMLEVEKVIQYAYVNKVCTLCGASCDGSTYLISNLSSVSRLLFNVRSG